MSMVAQGYHLPGLVAPVDTACGGQATVERLPRGRATVQRAF